jgi:transglutaminase-like putative cysteine protease
MLLTVNHTTNYNYDDNLIGLMQTTKLIPSPYNGLKIIEWDVTRNSEKGGEIFKDAEGNNIINFKSNDSDKIINFTVIGKVETFNTDGIYNSENDKISPLVYLRNTNLTQPNKEILDLASDAKGKFENSETLKIAHSILALVSDQISYVPYTTNTHTTAAEAMSQKKGVCQDQAHIMISAAKALGIPARYVSGYMHKNQNDSKFQATHAWAELYIKDIGWIGFDPTNQCCPDERYIRVSCGLDASFAAPIRGVYYGNSIENLDIHVQTIENSPQ